MENGQENLNCILERKNEKYAKLFFTFIASIAATGSVGDSIITISVHAQ